MPARELEDSLAEGDTLSLAANGLAAQVTDANGRLTVLDWDVHDRLIEVDSPPLGTIRYRRNGAGDPVLITDADGVAETHTYLFSGLPARVERGDWTLWAASYDDGGRIEEATRAGTATRQRWDDLDRLERRDVGWSNGAGTHFEELTYSGASEHRQTRTIGPVASGTSATTTFGYNAWGWLTSVSDAEGTRAIEYGVHGLPRVHTDENGYRAETRYDGRRRVVRR